MKPSVNQWKVVPEIEAAKSLHPALEQRKIPVQFASWLWEKGIRKEEELTEFFNPDVTAFHDPFLMHDMAKGITRIQEGIANGEKILIYGDYDADGITSTTVMKEAIEMLGGEPIIYIPDRFMDGYGPNEQVYRYFIEEQGVQLIITVDNGVAGYEPVKYAMEAGVDVVITDHHELPTQLPEALAVIHPRHPLGKYPFGDLAGVGVAFKVATALLGSNPLELLDLVAIGTIADLVSLTGENRALVALGLQVFRETDRIGLVKLCEVAEIDLNKVDETNIGFGIAPRLNALGRLEDGTPGVHLLTTFDEEQAEELAHFIQQQNEKRQNIVKQISQEALAMVEQMPNHSLYVLAKKGWHEGVLGIVASRIVEATGKPALVLGINEKGIAKGSGRSVGQLNLYEALCEEKDLFLAFGGHHMAAGFSLEATLLPELQRRLDAYIEREEIDLTKGKEVSVLSAPDLSDIQLEFIESLAKLGPFGTDNEAPCFLFENYQMEQVKQIGADKTHLKLVAEKNQQRIDVLAFNKGQEIEEFMTVNPLAFIGELQINEWNDRKKPQVLLKDYEVKGLQVFDYRGKKQELRQVREQEALYVYWDEKAKPSVGDTWQYQADLVGLTPRETVVLVDCPVDSQEVRQVIETTKASRLYCFFLSEEEYYLNGLPNRQKFARLYQLTRQVAEVDIRYKLPQVASALKLSQKELIFMIQVFFELGFVRIDNGVMKQVVDPLPHPLEESPSYKEREQRIQTEKQLLYSQPQELYTWLAQ